MFMSMHDTYWYYTNAEVLGSHRETEHLEEKRPKDER